MAPTPGESAAGLGSRLEAQSRRLLDRCLDAHSGVLLDPELAEHLAQVLRSLSEMGADPYVGGLIIDIRQQKQSEQALRASEESFRALAENANDGILIAAGDGRHVYANARAAEITGYSVAELLDLGFTQLAHPDEVDRLRRIYRKRMDTGEGPRCYQTRVRHKTGREVFVEITAARSPWHGQAADILIVRDVTRRREITQALRESEERYAAVVEQGRDGIAIVQDDVLVFANAALGRLLGHEPATLVGRHFLDLVDPEHRDAVRRGYLARVAGDEASGYGVAPLCRSDGSVALLPAYGTLIHLRGRPALLAIVRHPEPTEPARPDEESGPRPAGGS
jgi:PAS domain S-box-containing protein